MVLVSLTPQKWVRHEKGIESIRRRLFRRYAPADYFVVPNSEQVIAASAESCWNAACGDYRVLRIGGLTYRVDCRDQDGLCRFSVSHFDADRFSFWLCAARGHTLTSLLVRFRELDEVAYRCVCSCRRANIAPKYAARKPAGDEL